MASQCLKVPDNSTHFEPLDFSMALYLQCPLSDHNRKTPDFQKNWQVVEMMNRDCQNWLEWVTTGKAPLPTTSFHDLNLKEITVAKVWKHLTMYI